MKRALVTGAGGFIGNALTKYLKDKGYWVRGVDVKYPEWGESAADEFEIYDLREGGQAQLAVMKDDRTISSKQIGYFDEVYALAADMGGMGFISSHHAQILRNNALININTLDAVLRIQIFQSRYHHRISARGWYC